MNARRVAAAVTAAVAAAVMLARLKPVEDGARASQEAEGAGRRSPRRGVLGLAAWHPQPPATPAGRALAYAWASPVTLAGVLVGLTGGSRPAVRDGVLLFAGARGPIGWLLRRRGFTATALGHAVVARGEPSPELLAHELAHVRQAERLGVLFGPVYVGLLARYGYRDHPLELAARAEAGRRS